MIAQDNFKRYTAPSSMPSAHGDVPRVHRVFIPKLRNAIKSLCKEELIKPYEAERTIKKRDNLYVTVYNMEVVLLLAFRLNSYQARAVRRELVERISRDHKPFEVILTAINGTTS